jgi:serine/threonine-protein kinase RsbW
VTPQTVTIKVPPVPDHLALLRQAIWTLAARQHFTLDQMDDLRMAVEEGAAQLLRHGVGDGVRMDAVMGTDGIEVRLATTVADDDPVVDETSFAYQILLALTDSLRIERADDHATIILFKRRVVDVPDEDDT